MFLSLCNVQYLKHGVRCQTCKIKLKAVETLNKLMGNPIFNLCQRPKTLNCCCEPCLFLRANNSDTVKSHPSVHQCHIFHYHLMSSPANYDPMETLICTCNHAHTKTSCISHFGLTVKHCSGEKKMDLLCLGITVYPFKKRMYSTATLLPWTICSMTKCNYVPHNRQFKP